MTLHVYLELGSHGDDGGPGAPGKSTKWSKSPLPTISSLNPAMLSQKERAAYTPIATGSNDLRPNFGIED